MREHLLTNVAKGALMNIGKRIGKPSASSPGVGKGSDNEAGKKGRVAPTKHDKYSVNVIHGDLKGEIFG